ncbi:ArgK protein, partial [Rhodopirellula maiorica SM1]
MSSPTLRNDIATLVERLRGGDRWSLARLLTLAASPEQHGELIAKLATDVPLVPPEAETPVIAVTGSAGVGKSSLLCRLAAEYAEQGEYVGVLACDPESPLSGGAVLGDRCRIAGGTKSPPISHRVFIRSLSTESGQQGVANNLAIMLRIMKAFGFDRIFIETVGSGQGDVAVRDLADGVVLV